MNIDRHADLNSRDEKKLVLACVAMGVLGFTLFMGMPIAAEAMHSDLGFGHDRIGYMASAEYGGMFLASLLAATFVTRISRRLLAGLGICLAIFSGSVSLFYNDFASLLPLRLLSGIGSGIGYSVAVAVMAGTSDKAKNFTYFIVAQVVTNAVILYTFPTLSYHYGIDGIYVAYILIFTLGLIPLRWIPRSAEEVTGETTAGLKDSLHGVPVGLPLLCLLGIFGFYSMIGIYWTYVYLIGIDLGFAVDWLDKIMAGLTLLSLLGCWIALVFARKFGQFRPFLAAFLALESILILNVVDITVFTYFLGMVGVFFFWNLIDIYQLGTIASIDHSGRFCAMVPGAQGLGMAVSPAIAGTMLGASGDFHVIMELLVGFILLSIVAYSIVYGVLRRLNPTLANID